MSDKAPKSFDSTKIYNSATKEKEDFTPIIEGQVGLYVCGVTIYDQLHLGHARTFVAFDAIVRWFHFLYGQENVKFVRNITDIDDKIIARAKERGVTPEALTQQYTTLMHSDFESLNLVAPTVEPKVSEHLDEIVEMIQILKDKGFAYEADNGDTLFNVRKLDGYGALSGQNLDMIGSQFNSRELIKETAKESQHDFVLWKRSDDPEASYPSPLGQGRPGWHIECSAMSKKHLGANFDIHGGGGDLIFPHHENEVAQSVAANDSPYANTWMHTGMITVDGVKMSKSLGNFVTIEDLLKKYDPEVVRLFLLSSHYRSNVDFTESAIEQAAKNREKVYRALQLAEEKVGKKIIVEKKHTDFMVPIIPFYRAMQDDFNTPAALSVIYDMVKRLNKSEKAFTYESYAAVIIAMGSVLGLFQQDPNEVLKQNSDDEIEALIKEREEARASKDWARADEIRDILNAKGVSLNDKKI